MATQNNLGKPAILLNCHLPTKVNKIKRSGQKKKKEA